MASAILDASAILAVLQDEPGADRVYPALPGALVSAVNYAEVMSKLVEGGADRHKARQHVLALGIRVVDFDAGLADRVGELRRLTRHLGLSLADRACLALAEREQGSAFTGDRTWLGSVLGIDVQVIR